MGRRWRKLKDRVDTGRAIIKGVYVKVKKDRKDSKAERRHRKRLTQSDKRWGDKLKGGKEPMGPIYKSKTTGGIFVSASTVIGFLVFAYEKGWIPEMDSIMTDAIAVVSAGAITAGISWLVAKLRGKGKS